MSEGRCITWLNERDANENRSKNLEVTPSAFRRRDSASTSDPLDACRLRRMESYPSSQAFPSRESIGSSASYDSSEIDELPQDEEPPIETCLPPPPRTSGPEVLPATSQDFAELFPSSKKLLIRHDDTTLDGNLNLRVDAPVTTTRGMQRDITLYHLRMYDLRCRDFSLRRYSRDSGREVCHCARKSHKSRLGARPNIQRSLSSAFAAMLPKGDGKPQQAQPQQQQDHQQHPKQHSALVRQDSGYDTMHDEVDEHDLERPHSSNSNKAPAKDSVDWISVEFSNYAHVDVKRRGFKSDKRYDFDYWGSSYSWHRSTKKLGRSREVSYHLTRRDGSLVARIDPEALSEDEVVDEADKGGWIPRCSFQVVDKKVNGERQGDVADVVVATGLVVLADDCIRRRFRHQEAKDRPFSLDLIKGIALPPRSQTEPADKGHVPHGRFDHAYRKLLAGSL
ncbi:MAG: hypothetical protein Q9159_001412 [Coniocarpon cinnabarinum]